MKKLFNLKIGVYRVSRDSVKHNSPSISSFLKMGQWAILKVVVLIAPLIIISLAMPSIVIAGDFDNNLLSYAPPGLDQQQAQRWVNSLPWARVYLARLYNIDPRVAETYGAEYKSPTCGLALLEGKASDYSYDFGAGARWDVVFKPIEPFTPLQIPKYEQSKPSPIVVKYDAPPSLDIIQQARWGQSLPWAKAYLARLWDISKEEALKYGAEY